MDICLPKSLDRMLREIPALERAYLAGGCVRDAVLGIPQTDFDIEVFGLTYEELGTALKPWGRVDLVGKAFGVIKLRTPEGEIFDFGLPRRDSKVWAGHKGFDISLHPEIALEEAAARRDFTINALMYDPRARRVLDFFQGIEHLRQRVLRHTSPAFTEDPLRVLRGMQFAGRFNLRPDPSTIELSRSIRASYRELPVERVRDEWFKWAGKSVVPSAGLKFLAASGWIEHFPEIAALRGTPQDPDWHPEGDVFVHTCHCCDALAGMDEWRSADTDSRIAYMLAILAHDFAKPQTTQTAIRDGQQRIVSPGHEEQGGPIAEGFLRRIGAPNVFLERVIPLVTNHLAHLQEQTDRSVRRLAKRLEPETILGLTLVMTADHMGRPPKPAVVPPGVITLREKAAELHVQQSAPKKILLGRHLLELGMKPSAAMGRIVDSAYDAQLEGKFLDLKEALKWLAGQRTEIVPPEVHAALRERMDG